MSLGLATLGLYKAAWGLPDKSLYGAPCNNCGLCCLASQCQLSQMVFGPQTQCPAIARNLENSTIECGLIVAPDRWIKDDQVEPMRELAMAALGVDRGCDATHNEADLAVQEANPDLFEATPETLARVEAAIKALESTRC